MCQLCNDHKTRTQPDPETARLSARAEAGQPRLMRCECDLPTCMMCPDPAPVAVCHLGDWDLCYRHFNLITEPDPEELCEPLF